MYSHQQILEGFKTIPLTDSKLIMIHSSYKALGGVEGGAATVIDVLQDYVGNDGTVLYPNFNFHSWTEGHYFDYKETPSKMGIIGELARFRPGAVRTPHPIYTFAAIGPLAEEFAACDDPEAYGPNSVFARFHDFNGMIISIGLHWNSTFSLHHYVEFRTGCNYRRVKAFSGIYVGRDGEPEIKTSTMFVRKNLQIITDIVPGMDHLHNRGVIKDVPVGDASVHYATANDFFDAMSIVVQEHPEWLHRLEKPGFK